MRRQRPKGTPTPTSIIGDITKEVPQAKLAAIGALTLAFNEVEANLDRLFFIVTGLDEHLQLEVSTRINGIPGKIEIISSGSERILETKDWGQLTEAMGKGVFGSLKTYRDCVMHARHINPATWIGVKVDRQAQVFDVLLDERALNNSYNLLVVLRKELDEAVALIHGTRVLKQIAADDPDRAPLEAKTAGHLVQFRRYRTERLSLPPIPEFPSESELRVADFQAKQAQTAAVMAWHRQSFDFPLPPRNNALLDTYYPAWVPPHPDEEE